MNPLSRLKISQLWTSVHWMLLSFPGMIALLGILASPQLAAQQTPFPDNGDLMLVYLPASTADEKIVEDLLKNHGGVSEVLDGFNESIRLGDDVWVVFAPWSVIETREVNLEPNAAYDSATREILISYGLLIEIMKRFQRHNYIDAQAADFDLAYEFATKVFPNVMHTLTHELVHAMVDVNGVGQGQTCEEQKEEEIWADEVSVLIMPDFEDAGFDFAPVVMNFDLATIEAEQYGDTQSPQNNGCKAHAVSYERAEQFVCWLYGRSPENYTYLVDNPQDWQHCQAAYQELEAVWEERLEPFLK